MKTLQTQWLMVMNEFNQLDASDKYKLHIGLLGNVGEGQFKNDWIPKYLHKDAYVFKDFWFNVFDQYHQIDFVIFNHKTIELIDIKNFEGSLHFDNETFFVNNNEVLKNPLPKAQEHVRFMKEWLYRNNLPEVQINGNLIFINQHASLSGVPNTEIKCMMPNEIRNYLRNIQIHPRSHKSERIINAFLNNDLECPYLPPILDKKLMHRGWKCPACQSRKFDNGNRHFLCSCGSSFSKEKFAVEEICKYGVLYHHKDIYLNELTEYFDGLFNKSFLNSCLRRNFTKYGRGYQNPRKLIEYYQPNKIYRYKDKIVK